MQNNLSEGYLSIFKLNLRYFAKEIDKYILKEICKKGNTVFPGMGVRVLI